MHYLNSYDYQNKSPSNKTLDGFSSFRGDITVFYFGSIRYTSLVLELTNQSLPSASALIPIIPFFPSIETSKLSSVDYVIRNDLSCLEVRNVYIHYYLVLCPAGFFKFLSVNIFQVYASPYPNACANFSLISANSPAFEPVLVFIFNILAFPESTMYNQPDSRSKTKWLETPI